jgi:hypothetical protein
VSGDDDRANDANANGGCGLHLTITTNYNDGTSSSILQFCCCDTQSCFNGDNCGAFYGAASVPYQPDNPAADGCPCT